MQYLTSVSTDETISFLLKIYRKQGADLINDGYLMIIIEIVG